MQPCVENALHATRPVSWHRRGAHRLLMPTMMQDGQVHPPHLENVSLKRSNSKTWWYWRSSRRSASRGVNKWRC